MKKLIFLTLTLSLLCCGHKAEKKETYKAAETTKQKNAEEQFNLGKSYYKNGDYVKAAEWYRKAAEQGFHLAQIKIALMYFKGRGVPRNYIQAYKWYNITLASSDSLLSKTASDILDLLEELMTPDQIAKAQKESQEFKVKH